MQFAFHGNGSFMIIHHMIHIIQAQAEPFHIMLVVGIETGERLKDQREVRLFNSQSIVNKRDHNVVPLVPGADGKFQGIFAVFDGVVDQVGESIGQVGKVAKNNVPFRTKIEFDRALTFSDSQMMDTRDPFKQAVDENVFLVLVREVIGAEHGKHLVHEVAHRFRFIRDHPEIGILGGFILFDRLILKKLAGQIDSGERSFQLMHHIVNHVLAELVDFVLSPEAQEKPDKAEEQHDHGNRQHRVAGHHRRFRLVGKHLDRLMYERDQQQGPNDAQQQGEP